MDLPKSREKPTNIVLSRFFDSNVRLVADVCSRCYLDDDDVKIVAVNRKFLKQVLNRKNLKRTANSLHNHCSAADSQQSIDRCQNDRLKLPIATSTKDNYALITDSASAVRIKPPLNYNHDTKDTTSLCTTENPTKCANEIYDTHSVSDFFKNVQNKNEKSQIFSLDSKKINLAKLATEKSSSFKPQESSYKNDFDENANSTREYTDIETINGNYRYEKIHLAKLKIEETFSSTNNPKKENQTCLKIGNSKRFRSNGPVNLKKLKIKKIALWSPPRSPHNLIEESLFRDPWSLLVATIFLNKTSCMCARPRVAEFLHDFSGPWDVLQKHPSELEKYFLDLGLFKKRAEQVWRMSHDYVHTNWKSPKELYGIGKYGEDAYRMFILGDLDIEPTDRFLRIYRDWAKMKEKEEKMMHSEDDYLTACMLMLPGK